MQIYSQLRFTNPNAPEGSPERTYGWVYQPVLEKLYGFDHLYCYYFLNKPNELEYDEADMIEKVGNTDTFPDGLVMLNLEGGAWQIFDQYYNVQQKAIEKRIEILLKLKSLRPDCQFLFYGHPPASDWELPMCFPDRWFAGLQACKELIELQGMMMPQFYFRRVVYYPNWNNTIAQTPERVTQWATRVLETLRNEYPKTEIVPIIWPCDWTWWKQNSGSDQHTFKWDNVNLVESRVAGGIFKAALDVISKHCDKLVIWGQGHAPWDSRADWFVELMRKI